MMPTQLPGSWVCTPLGEVAQVQLGRQRSPKNHSGRNMRPYLRAANVTWNGLSLDDVKQMNFSESEVETFRLMPGDILLSEASGSSSEVGKPAIWCGEIDDCCFQNTLLRVRSNSVEKRYLFWFFKWLALSGQFARGSRGVGIHHLGAKALSDWPIPLAPLAEQERIVAAIEEQLSSLDAGVAAVNRAKRNVRQLRISHLHDLLAHTDEQVVSISEVTNSIQYGYTAKASQSPVGPKMLRITDIQDGRVDWEAVPHCQIEPANLVKYLLAPGDLVFARTGATVGKSYLIRDAPEAVFASYLIRLRFQEGVLPEYVSLFFQSHDYWRQVTKGSLGIGQPNVNATTLSKIQLRLPGTDQQDRTIKAMREIDLALDGLMRSLNTQVRRSQKMRSSILSAAFSGRLVSQDPSEATASPLFDDLLAEPATALTPKPRRAKAKR